MRNKIIVAIVAVLVIITAAYFYFFENSQPFSEEKMVSIVENLPEVLEFKKEIQESENNGRFLVQVAASPDEELPYYLIQVAEVLSDHTATFGWYRFDPETKTVEKEL